MTGTTRRSLIRRSLLGAGALALAPSLKVFGSAGGKSQIEVSLAEWSLHRAIYGGKLDHLDFRATAKREFGISAVEYVNGFFGGKKMGVRVCPCGYR